MSDDLLKRLRAAADTMRRMKAASFEARELEEAADRIEELEAKLEKAQEALGFYAKDEHWNPPYADPGMSPFSAAEEDEGEIARATLAELKGAPDA